MTVAAREPIPSGEKQDTGYSVGFQRKTAGGREVSLGEQLWGYGGGDPYEDNGNFPGLQFNPAPGVPQAVGDLVEDLNRAHGNITSASEALRNVSDGGWTGASADAFRAKTAALQAAP